MDPFHSGTKLEKSIPSIWKIKIDKNLKREKMDKLQQHEIIKINNII